MRSLTTTIIGSAVLASFAQVPSWNISAQFRNPVWSDTRVLEPKTPLYLADGSIEDNHKSIAAGISVERQFANGCAVRLGFEHARNAMDRDQSIGYRNLEISRLFRQETNTFTLGVVHYAALNRLEPFFGAEAVIRSMDDLRETIDQTERNGANGGISYQASERIRYSGGSLYGIAPVMGFRYRIAGGFCLGGEFAPTWAWGKSGQTRSSVSVQQAPDQITYDNGITYGGTSGGPFFVPRFGIGVSYCLAKKAAAPAPSGTEPMVVPAK